MKTNEKKVCKPGTNMCVSMSQYHSAFVPPIKSKRKMMTDEKNIMCIKRFEVLCHSLILYMNKAKKWVLYIDH